MADVCAAQSLFSGKGEAVDSALEREHGIIVLMHCLFMLQT